MHIKNRQKLIEDFIPLANKLAKAFITKYSLFEELEDYTSVAYVGLCKAAKKFKLNKGLKFSTLAYIYIHGAMLDEFRKTDMLTREERQRRINGEDIESAITVVSLDDIIPNTTQPYSILLIDESTIEDDILRKEYISRLIAIIKKLPTLEKKIIALYLSDKHNTIQDIGITLGISTTTTFNFLQSALNTIKKELHKQN